MVGIHLGIVPGGAATLRVNATGGIRQAGIHAGDGPGDCAGLPEVAFRQVAAVGAGVGDQLVFLVQGLGGVEDVLGPHAESLARFYLQGGE